LIGGIFCSGVIERGVSILTGSGLGVLAIKLIINEKKKKKRKRILYELE
jgi:hypothetical protein